MSDNPYDWPDVYVLHRVNRRQHSKQDHPDEYRWYKEWWYGQQKPWARKIGRHWFIPLYDPY